MANDILIKRIDIPYNNDFIINDTGKYASVYCYYKEEICFYDIDNDTNKKIKLHIKYNWIVNNLFIGILNEQLYSLDLKMLFESEVDINYFDTHKNIIGTIRKYLKIIYS